MNRKGQTLVIFIILIPVFLLLGALIVDSSYTMYNKSKLNNVTKDVIKHDLKKKELTKEEIESIYKSSDIPIDNLKITKDNGMIEISNNYYIKSIFGKIVGIDEYEIGVKKQGRIENGFMVIK